MIQPRLTTQPTKSPADGPEGPRDAELVAGTLAGRDADFERLVERYQQAVFKIAYYKSRNASDAEDLSQDIFLAAYKALPTLKDVENFGGWLFGIAHNRCHKWFRRERTKVVKLREVGQLLEQERRTERRDRESEDRTAQLSQEIEDLPHEIRRVLVLKYLEGQSYEAIETRLGIKPYRIDYLIRKGKALLKRRMLRREAR